MRALTIAAIVLLAAPLAALADTTITLDPVGGEVPNTVSYTNDNLGECEVYLASSPSAPIAYLADSPFCGTSGVLNSVPWASGSFDGTIPGDYMYVQPRTAGCTNLSYTACASANANIPGSLEADFTLVAAEGTSTLATSTLSAADAVLTYLLFILDAFWFVAVFVGVLIAFKFIFKLS